MVQQLADKLGVSLDSIEGKSDYATHGKDIQTSVGLIEAGRVVARRIACEGRVNGKAIITAEHITRMAAEVAPDWSDFQGVGESNYRIVISGNPDMRCELDLGRRGDIWRSIKATAMRVVNAIPAVSASAPGLLSAIDLPQLPSKNIKISGGSLWRQMKKQRV